MTRRNDDISRLSTYVIAIAWTLAASGWTRSARAQAQPPPSPTSPPPYPYAYPPPYPYPYTYPPPYPYGYPPPYPYAYPPPPAARPPPQVPYGYQPPLELPYKEGQPVPMGYRLTEEPRSGFLIAGWLTAGIPYGIGLMTALAANFENSSELLIAPIAGPWLTLGLRDYAKCEGRNGEEHVCLGDVFIAMALTIDGTMQAAGGSLLLVGYLVKKKKLVRNDVAFHIAPRRIVGGYGLIASGAF